MSTLQLEPQKQKILFDKSYLVSLLEFRFPPSKAVPFNQLFFLFLEFSNPPIIHIPPGFPPPHAISPQSKEAGNRNNIWISTYGRWREGGRGQIGNHHHQRKIHEVEEKASICPVFTKFDFQKKNNKIMALCITLQNPWYLLLFFALFVKFNTSCVHVLISPLPSRRKGEMGEKEEAINQSGGNSNQENSRKKKNYRGKFSTFQDILRKVVKSKPENFVVFLRWIFLLFEGKSGMGIWCSIPLSSPLPGLSHN